LMPGSTKGTFREKQEERKNLKDFVWLFWKWGLENYLSRLDSKFQPPSLRLPRN
jgi:hypothetical protein